MAFYRITRNEKYDFATLHNWGCTFQCPFCSYKLRSGAEGRPGFAEPRPARFLSIAEQKDALQRVKPGKVYFMGGEPTVAREIEEMLAFAKHELGAQTKLGHTNGSRLPLPCLDGANVGFKAFSEELHQEITGRPKTLIYDNFARAYDQGLQMAANLVFIPELVGLAELEGLVRFLAALDREIPFHIMGYIPVPGQPWRRPTAEEMTAARQLAETYLKSVALSHLSPDEALDLTARDDRFAVSIIAGV
ncbi:MAG: radical SAM protein [Oligosphaeraceae bacterium]|nr:radical SAM protein [Oligosphaeraceae bacterium]